MICLLHAVTHELEKKIARFSSAERIIALCDFCVVLASLINVCFVLISINVASVVQNAT